MTREDIIRMARETQHWKSLYEATIKMLADNAAIQTQPVLLAEKESYEAGRMQGIKEGAAAEREACARIAERSESALHCAFNIRARK